MSDERLSYPMGGGYAEVLGVAMFMFARLEWNVIWCCERIKDGSVYELKEKTAGVIRKRLSKLVSDLPEGELREQLSSAAERFNPLVDLRNDLIHGTPMTDSEHGQCLRGSTGVWTITRINEAADSFAACAIHFNGLLYGALGSQE
ncbi:hypothetical protein [Pseudomonas kilonensis]|uniref:hypothetical protein n=1 Tax=Pseudomonas kilonensis TaxID=132476 RepID=UPI000463749C|nr:hypothetical protein [Pseudomonas kilonensis]